MVGLLWWNNTGLQKWNAKKVEYVLGIRSQLGILIGHLSGEL